MDLARSRCSEAGFSLLETMVSVGLLTAVAIGVAQVFAAATTANLGAHDTTSTAVLAAQKMEQLRGLTWGFGDETTLGLPVTDTTTNLATDPPGSDGSGLGPSPADSLFASTAGYVDYLDAEGRWIGTGTAPPSGTVFVRRWSVQPLPDDPDNTLVLQVRVLPLSADLQAAAATSGGRAGTEAWLVSVKTRKSP